MACDAKILAFLSLLIVHVFACIIYKFSQTKGTYAFSPLSVIASAEFIKLCISSTLLLYSISTDEKTTTFSFSNTIYSRLSACYTLFQHAVRKTFILYTFGLALLYVINNQLAFILFSYTNITSIFMFKSFSSFVTAILLTAFYQRNINREQWGSLILQMIGLLIVQYDAYQHVRFLPFKYYVILVGSTLISAVCSVWNEHLIKTYSVNIHIQNIVLYSFGLMLNLTLFFFLPNLFGQNDSKKHFFDGYSLSVYVIIIYNLVLGIVITFVYKHADAIVKTFSTGCTMGVLLYINVAVFKLKTNFTVLLGAMVIFVSSYLFFLVKPSPTISPTNLDTDVDTTRIEKNGSKWTQKFKWKCHLMSFVCGSLVFYFITYSFRNGTYLHSINNFHSTNTTSLSPKIISIEGNRPIVIHGVNLCSKKNLKAIRVLINSNICFPVEVCSNTILACHLRGTLNNQSLSGTVNISLITGAQRLSTSITLNTTIPNASLLSYWKKNDIVLVVHFNRPYYQRLSFLSIYRDLFSLVLFTGPEPHSGVIHCPEGNIGLQTYHCLSRAILLHPKHKGYLLMHFDLLPIFYNLQNESLTSFWISPIGCVTSTKDTGWWWWSHGSGLKAVKKVFDEIKVNLKNTSFHGRYAANYRKHAGERFCKVFPDIFYLPQRFIPDWLILTQLFNRHGVYHSITYPTVSYMMISGNLSTNLKMLDGEHFVKDFSLENLQNQSSLQFIHRINHVLESQQNLIKIVVRKSLLTAIN